MSYSYKKNIADSTWGQFPINNYYAIFNADFRDHVNMQGKIVEIGSGRGEFLSWLEKEGASDITGVEIDEDMMAEARGMTKVAKLLNMDAISGLTKMKNNSIDTLVAIDIFEHIQPTALRSLLAISYKKLKSNGILIGRLPNAESPLFGSYYRYNDVTHHNAFTRNSITQQLVIAGFNTNDISAIETGHRNNLLGILAYILRKFFELFARIIIFAYQGTDAFKLIFTPNLIFYAKK